MINGRQNDMRSNTTHDIDFILKLSEVNKKQKKIVSMRKLVNSRKKQKEKQNNTFQNLLILMNVSIIGPDLEILVRN